MHSLYSVLLCSSFVLFVCLFNFILSSIVMFLICWYISLLHCLFDLLICQYIMKLLICFPFSFFPCLPLHFHWSSSSVSLFCIFFCNYWMHILSYKLTFPLILKKVLKLNELLKFGFYAPENIRCLFKRSDPSFNQEHEIFYKCIQLDIYHLLLSSKNYIL